MAGRPVLPVNLNPRERRELERRTRSVSASVRDVERARIILLRAGGVTQEETAQKLGCSVRRVAKWVARFRRMGISGLVDKPGRGRKPGSVNRVKTVPGHKENRTDVGFGYSKRGVHGGGANSASAARKRRPRTGRVSRIMSEPISEDATDDLPNPGTLSTMRSVASAAGVSTATASRVLRGHGGVRRSLRDRVLQAATEQGYHADLHVRKLMNHLRRQRAGRLQGSICALTSPDPEMAGDRSYGNRILAGARARALELRVAWESLPFGELSEHPRRTMRMLYSRGVEGILLLPVYQKHRLPSDSAWINFSLVAATYSVAHSGLHRVVPDQFKNMQVVCRALSDRGCRRIGLVIPQGQDERVRNHFSGAFATYHIAAGHRGPPLIFARDGCTEHLRAWYERARPDAIVAESSWAAQLIASQLGLGIPGPVAFAVVAHLDPSQSRAGGIDELPEQVGAIAVNRLLRLIIHGEKGFSEHPTVTMIEGEWHDPQ